MIIAKVNHGGAYEANRKRNGADSEMVCKKTGVHISRKEYVYADGRSRYYCNT